MSSIIKVGNMSALKRSGFTLVELLVSMALTMFIMVILSQAFVTSLQVFSGLKAIGDMQANLRTVTTLLQDDLTMDHFEGHRLLSDPDLGPLPPRQGYFYLRQGTNPVAVAPAPYVVEGWESGKIPTAAGPPYPGPNLASYRATDHLLAFTVRNRGNERFHYFAAPLNPVPAAPTLHPLLTVTTNYFNQPPDSLYQEPNFYNSQWAEIAYFLVQTGSTDEPGNPTSTAGTPLHALYRSQHLLVPNPNGTNGNNGANQIATALPGLASYVTNAKLADYPNLSCLQGATHLVFNAPEDVINLGARVLVPTTTPPTRRTIPATVAVAGVAPAGASVVLTNVVSFQVQVYKQASVLTPSDFEDVGPVAYDSGVVPPPPYSIRALKITIRVWDSGTKQSRQVTLVQDM